MIESLRERNKNNPSAIIKIAQNKKSNQKKTDQKQQ